MNDTFFRNLLKIFFSFIFYYSGLLNFLLRKYLRNGLYVFNYHNFNTFTNSYWKFGSLYETNYRRHFLNQICFLEKHFTKVPHLEFEKISLDQAYFLITFDDGYKDNIEIGLPILNAHRIPAIFFICTGYTNNNNIPWYDQIRIYFEKKKIPYNWFHNIQVKKNCKAELVNIKNKSYWLKQIYIKKYLQGTGFENMNLMMDEKDLKMLFKSGMTVEPHTRTHPILTSLTDHEAEMEIHGSIEDLKKFTGHTPSMFCYPNGDFNQRILNILKRQGIRYGFTTIKGYNQNLSNPLKLKRIGVNPSDPVPVLALKIIVSLFRK